MDHHTLAVVEVILDAPALRNHPHVHATTTVSDSGNLLDVDLTALRHYGWSHGEQQLIDAVDDIIEASWDRLDPDNAMHVARAFTLHLTGTDPWAERDRARGTAVTLERQLAQTGHTAPGVQVALEAAVLDLEQADDDSARDEATDSSIANHEIDLAARTDLR